MQITLILLVQPRLLLTLPFCVVAVYIVQKVYLRTSRQLRLMDLESQAAVFSGFLETVRSKPSQHAISADLLL